MLRIVMSDTRADVYLVDDDGNEVEVRKFLPIESIKINSYTVRKEATITLNLSDFETEILAKGEGGNPDRVKWMMPHPLKGGKGQLRSIKFADSTVINFDGTAIEVDNE